MSTIPPKPDKSLIPTPIAGQRIAEINYSESSKVRCIVTVDEDGIFRVRTEFWDTSDWDIVSMAFWAEGHSGIFTDTLEQARVLCSEYMHLIERD